MFVMSVYLKFIVFASGMLHLLRKRKGNWGLCFQCIMYYCVLIVSHTIFFSHWIVFVSLLLFCCCWCCLFNLSSTSAPEPVYTLARDPVEGEVPEFLVMEVQLPGVVRGRYIVCVTSYQSKWEGPSGSLLGSGEHSLMVRIACSISHTFV